MARLVDQIKEALAAFASLRTQPAFVNNPKRTQDIEDIRSLLQANRGALNMDEVRRYFRLFEREALLDEIIANIDG